jgi:hypothetical protein
MEADVESSSSPQPHGPQRKLKLALLLLSAGFSMAAFLTFDWFYTARMHRAQRQTVQREPCRVRDPIRYHAFRPNCTAIDHWGKDSYLFATNSLGFRDEKVREVPPTDPRPRILLLGDSFTEGKLAWGDSFAGRIAARFPQYDVLNGGLANYSPSNYLNTVRMVLDKGVEIDEVIVFLDNSAVQLEAAFFRDIDSSDAVEGLGFEHHHLALTRYARLRGFIAKHFALTAGVFRLFDGPQRFLVAHGFYHLPGDYAGDPFDLEMSAWTYRKVDEVDPWPAGYAPLGVEGGIAKEKARMTLLWQELAKQSIPLSVVIYPHLGQVVHDTVDSTQVQIFRQWCEGRCQRFISVLPAFFAVKEQCPWLESGCWYNRYFIFGDNHFNAAGNALVADAVITSLSAEPPLKAHPSSSREPANQSYRVAK